MPPVLLQFYFKIERYDQIGHIIFLPEHFIYNMVIQGVQADESRGPENEVLVSGNFLFILVLFCVLSIQGRVVG